MASRKRKTPAPERAPQRLSCSAVERWRNSCPVRPEHKSLFPADEWLWQPGAAAWVWGALKAAGGRMPAEELSQSLAQLRDSSYRQAHGLRNRGLTVLEVFGLIKIERFPTVRGSRPTSAYGNVSIVRDRIDEKEMCERKKQAMANTVMDILSPEP